LSNDTLNNNHNKNIQKLEFEKLMNENEATQKREQKYLHQEMRMLEPDDILKDGNMQKLYHELLAVIRSSIC
jgi:hypothetical protein